MGCELARDGQVFFLHNRVDRLDAVAARLTELLPEAVVRVAHGQMPEDKLEKVMREFGSAGFDILVATTIIENGIDLPNANTIVIDDADRLGLAQLHQLRGRVGRSDRDAVALLMTAPAATLSDEARARLRALDEFDQLGAGFDLAQRDLELRGAGQLLGEDQSGRFMDIGHALYARMLSQAIKVLERDATLDPEAQCDAGPEVDLGAPALFPADFIKDMDSRLAAYLAVSSASSAEELEAIKGNLTLQHGPMPSAGQTLFDATRLQLRCESLGVAKLSLGTGGGRVTCAPACAVDRDTLAEWLATEIGSYSLNEDGTIDIHASLDNLSAVVDFADLLLDALG